MRSSSSSAAPSWPSAFGMGAVSGAAAKTATAPLERVRLVLQTSTQNNAAASSFARANFVEVLRAEGVLGLWRGNALGVARAVLTKGTLFATQDHLSAALGSDASAGALAGVCAHVPAYPLDLLRTRIAGAVGAEASITAVLGEVLRSGGVLALYRGAPATAGGAIAYEGTRFGVFGALTDGETSPAGAAGVGVAASLVAGAVCYPNDTIRRKQQWSLDSPGYLSTFRELLAEGGAPRIYRGLPLYLAKVAPAAAVQFGTYHLLKRLHRKYSGGGGDGGG